MLLSLLVVGGASGGLGTPTVIAIPNPSPAAGAAFGVGVASLSDLNGDEVGDLAVGAPGAGRVYVLSGSDRAVIRTIDDPGAVPESGFGSAVLGVGDVNSDGVEDVAVGAPGSCFDTFCPLPIPCPVESCPPLPDAGRSFVFSGATGSLLRNLAPTSTFDGWHHGFALAGLGDVSGDGVPDVAVSAPMVNFSGYGEVRAFSGADGSELWVTREPPFPAAKPPRGSFGLFMSAVDDLDGDGYADLLVSAPFADGTGKAYLLSGATGTILRTHQDVSGEFFGGDISGVGDQNGDGFEDYAVGDRGQDTVRLFSGKDGSLLDSIAIAPTASTYSVAHAEDWDGDGVDDMWVGAVGTGVVYLTTGTGTILSSAVDPIADPATTAPQDAFGWSVAVTDDIGADGQRDLIVGDGGEARGQEAATGSAYLVLLCADQQAPTLSVTVTPSVLWPPNHKYQTVEATVSVADNVDADVEATLDSVTSNEPDQGAGDGDTANDIVIVDDHTFRLRAERSATGSGRIYTIAYRATDKCGNEALATATVTVLLTGP